VTIGTATFAAFTTVLLIEKSLGHPIPLLHEVVETRANKHIATGRNFLSFTDFILIILDMLKVSVKLKIYNILNHILFNNVDNFAVIVRYLSA
jgi:hypothetical protein